jgi:hypothetical protein
MRSDPHLRLIAAIAELALARRRARRTVFVRRSVREPLSMLMLWTLTAAMGLTLAIVAISGVAGHPHRGWHVPAEVFRETRPQQFESVYDAEQHSTVRRPLKEVAMTIHIPSPSAYGLAAIGLVACLAGFSRRRISALGLLSAALLLASVTGPFLFIIAAQSFFWVLDAVR